MYDDARKYRSSMKSKAEKMAAGSSGKVDSSDWTPSEPANMDVQTGERPVSRRQYRSGGAVSGDFAQMRADRKPRASGGSANSWINRDVKAANEDRDGTKHVGGFAGGGGVGKDEKGHGSNPRGPEKQGYNAESVDKAINSAYRGQKAPTSRQRSVTHALLRGRYASGGNVGDTVPTSRLAFTGGESRLSKVAGLKKGGRTAKAFGGMLGILPELLDASGKKDKDAGSAQMVGRKSGGSVDGSVSGTPIKGGRTPRATGGRTGKDAKGHGSNPKNIGHYSISGLKIPLMDAKSLPDTRSAKARAEDKAAWAKPRASGGRTKGKMNVNIIIGQPGAQNAPPPMPVPAPPPMAGPMHPPVPPPQMPPPGVGAPPPMPMARKSGGRTYYAGAGSGEGRLEKIGLYGSKAR